MLSAASVQNSLTDAFKYRRLRSNKEVEFLENNSWSKILRRSRFNPAFNRPSGTVEAVLKIPRDITYARQQVVVVPTWKQQTTYLTCKYFSNKTSFKAAQCIQRQITSSWNFRTKYIMLSRLRDNEATVWLDTIPKTPEQPGMRQFVLKFHKPAQRILTVRLRNDWTIPSNALTLPRKKVVSARLWEKFQGKRGANFNADITLADPLSLETTSADSTELQKDLTPAVKEELYFDEKFTVDVKLLRLQRKTTRCLYLYKLRRKGLKVSRNLSRTQTARMQREVENCLRNYRQTKTKLRQYLKSKSFTAANFEITADKRGGLQNVGRPATTKLATFVETSPFGRKLIAVDKSGGDRMFSTWSQATTHVLNSTTKTKNTACLLPHLARKKVRINKKPTNSSKSVNTVTEFPINKVSTTSAKLPLLRKKLARYLSLYQLKTRRLNLSMKLRKKLSKSQFARLQQDIQSCWEKCKLSWIKLERYLRYKRGTFKIVHKVDLRPQPEIKRIDPPAPVSAKEQELINEENIARNGLLAMSKSRAAATDPEVISRFANHVLRYKTRLSMAEFKLQKYRELAANSNIVNQKVIKAPIINSNIVNQKALKALTIRGAVNQKMLKALLTLRSRVRATKRRQLRRKRMRVRRRLQHFHRCKQQALSLSFNRKITTVRIANNVAQTQFKVLAAKTKSVKFIVVGYRPVLRAHNRVQRAAHYLGQRHLCLFEGFRAKLWDYFLLHRNKKFRFNKNWIRDNSRWFKDNWVLRKVTVDARKPRRKQTVKTYRTKIKSKRVLRWRRKRLSRARLAAKKRNAKLANLLRSKRSVVSLKLTRQDYALARASAGAWRVPRGENQKNLEISTRRKSPIVKWPLVVLGEDWLPRPRWRRTVRNVRRMEWRESDDVFNQQGFRSAFRFHMKERARAPWLEILIYTRAAYSTHLREFRRWHFPKDHKKYRWLQRVRKALSPARRNRYIRGRRWSQIRRYNQKLFYSLFNFRNRRRAHRHFNKLDKRSAPTFSNFIRSHRWLTTRLDVNLVLLGIAPSIYWARVVAPFGLVRVNGKTLYQIDDHFRVGDHIQIDYERVQRFQHYFQPQLNARDLFQKPNKHSTGAYPANFKYYSNIQVAFYAHAPEESDVRRSSRFQAGFSRCFKHDTVQGLN
jgi:hypothetical protein